jgi:hypothetical protein
VLFTFPSRYSFPIGGQGVLSLGGWSPLLPTGFPVSRGTQAQVARPQACSVRYGALTRCGAASQRLPLTSSLSLKRRPPSCQRGTQPAYNPAAPHVAARPRRFGLVPFRSPLLRESRLISSPHGTEMFQFPRFPPHAYRIQRAASAHDSREVAPFGFGWLFARLQLPIHVSPLSAPFVGSWPLGIHPTPCFAWLYISSGFPSSVSQRFSRIPQP